MICCLFSKWYENSSTVFQMIWKLFYKSSTDIYSFSCVVDVQRYYQCNEALRSAFYMCWKKNVLWTSSSLRIKRKYEINNNKTLRPLLGAYGLYTVRNSTFCNFIIRTQSPHLVDLHDHWQVHVMKSFTLGHHFHVFTLPSNHYLLLYSKI